MSLNLAIMKLYGVVGNITYTERPPKTIICGRTVNQSDTYTLRFTKEVRNQKHYHETEEYFLAPIKQVIETGSLKDVYNIEVEDDNSYTVNNCIVHNCQAWSVAGKQLGDKDERGMLFWTTLDIIKTVLKHNPNAKFLMENVKMKKDFEQYITYHTEQALGKVGKILINSALLSAQNRQRYYWTNFDVTQPEDKGILLKDVLEEYVNTKWVIDTNKQNFIETLLIEAKKHKGIYPTQLGNSKQFGNSIGFKNKAFTLRASNPNGVLLCNTETKFRKLTPLECERLQTVPDNWTECLSNTQRYKSLGNGWTIDVIVHILECAFK
jgi:DNA (cytosine-5)-methyltransferase 1/DNA (cytosine-5)-methyltransferase 3A